MNYFEFYNLGISFKVDEKALKLQYLENSKKYHPDFFALEVAEKQDEVLGLSTLNNQAYKVLSNSDLRCKYILEQYNLLEEGEKYALPQEFLMEMMEVNESLMDLEMDGETDKARELDSSVQEISNEIEKKLEQLYEDFEKSNESDRLILLAKIKDLYFRKKYLLRIQESLIKIASQFK